MQAKLDKLFDVNARKVNDMVRLKQYIERLRCDFQMLSLNKKQSKLVGVGGVGLDDPDEMIQEASNDSERMVNDQISNSLELISKIIDANIASDSNEDLIDGF